MKIFFAGNFPQMKNPELEEASARRVVDQGITYKRLISFFFRDDMESVLRLKDVLDSDGKKTRLIK